MGDVIVLVLDKMFTVVLFIGWTVSLNSVSSLAERLCNKVFSKTISFLQMTVICPCGGEL